MQQHISLFAAVFSFSQSIYGERCNHSFSVERLIAINLIQQAQAHSGRRFLAMESGQKNPREFVEEGIQHVQQNKVNAKNAFDLQCIENMDVVLNVLQSDEDFHFAATTVESSAKIYGFRVDNVHAETFKVRGLFETYEDAEGGPDKSARKVRQVPVGYMKAAHCKTANELNIPDFDAMDKVENVDPYFAQMTHQTEKGGDQGLLLNLMPSNPRAGVIFNGQVPLRVDESALDDELERQKMSSESTFFKQVSTMLKKVTTAEGVMAPQHYWYLRECAKEGVFGAENIPLEDESRSPPTSPGRASPSSPAHAQPELQWDSENPDAPWWSPADLADIQRELSVEDGPLDAEMPTGQALLDQSEEELAAKELESNAIVEQKVVNRAELMMGGGWLVGSGEMGSSPPNNDFFRHGVPDASGF